MRLKRRTVISLVNVFLTAYWVKTPEITSYFILELSKYIVHNQNEFSCG